jgi:hypothetical protein
MDDELVKVVCGCGNGRRQRLGEPEDEACGMCGGRGWFQTSRANAESCAETVVGEGPICPICCKNEVSSRGAVTCGASECQETSFLLNRFVNGKNPLGQKSKDSLIDAINWIAQNDNSGNGDEVNDIAGYISTLLVADLWHQEPKVIAHIICSVRKRLGLPVGGA